MINMGQSGITTPVIAVTVLAVMGSAVGTSVLVDEVDVGPDSPFYALEKAGESVKEATVAGGQEWDLERAEERIREFQNVSEKNVPNDHVGLIKQAEERLKKGIGGARGQEGLQRSMEAVRNHIRILKGAENRVFGPAENAIKMALTRSRLQERVLENIQVRFGKGMIRHGRLKQELENKMLEVENLVKALENKPVPHGILKEVLENRQIPFENLKEIIGGRRLSPGILKEILKNRDVPAENLRGFLRGKALPLGIVREILENKVNLENVIKSVAVPKGPPRSKSFVHENGPLPGWVPGPPPWAGSGRRFGGGEEKETENFGYEKKATEDLGYNLFAGIRILNPPARYLINPTNGQGLDEGEIIEEITESFETWDDHTSVELFAADVSTTNKSGFQHDGENVISFGPIEESGSLGKTRIWFDEDSGNVEEFDIVLNTGREWGIDPDGEGPETIDEFDVRNITTHEVGHALVLLDVFDRDYAHLTMYHKSEPGSTAKVSLENGDIMGLHKLYGE